MRNPERLSASQRGLGLALLQAGDRTHQPPVGLLERTLTRVGAVGVVVTNMSMQAAAQTVAGLGTTAKTGVVGKATSLTAIFCKAVAVGGGIGAITMATAIGVRHFSSVAPNNHLSSSFASSGHRTSAAHQRAAHLETSPAQSSTAIDILEVMRAKRAPTPSITITQDVPVDPTSLATEARLMSQAQAAIELGQRDLALDILERHRLEFPTGQLKPEAVLLRARLRELDDMQNAK